MNSKKVFKNLVLIDAALFTLTLIITFFFQSERVERAYLHLHYYDSELNQLIVGGAALVTIALFYVAVVMLYKSYRFGRIAFLIYFILTITLQLIAGINVSEGLSNGLDYVQSATDGAVLAMLYFTAISTDFVKSKRRKR
jgi:hypothetical protein